MKKDSSYKHIFKYTGLFGAVQMLNVLIGLIRNKVIAVLLGPVGVGLISIYNSTTSLLQNTTNCGLHISGVREISQVIKEEDGKRVADIISTLRSWSLIAALSGTLLCLLLSKAISHWAFSSDAHTIHIMLLSPFVGLAILTACEISILKATRHLKELAIASILSVILALITSVPLYIKWKYEGIVPSLLIIGMLQFIIHAGITFRKYPYDISFSLTRLKRGKGMLILGAAFVVAGVMTSGSDFFVRSYLSKLSESLAGLYNAGYVITMTYAGMVFAAIESDYYPHLSSICSDTRKMTNAVNMQIEVSMIIIAPLLVALMFSLKFIIPLLFSSQFLPVLPMTQIAVLAMFFRALHLPVSYIVLAKGDSRSFMIMEGVGNIILVSSMIVCFNNWGLEGTGMALLINEGIYSLYVISFCCWRYDFGLSTPLLSKFTLHIAMASASLAVVRLTGGITYYALGILLCLASLATSLHMFRHRQYNS